MKKIDFIAEVSSNHNRDLNRMIDFIHATKDSGCTGVKFQLFKIDELFAPEIIKNNESVRSRKNWELQENYIPRLAQEAHKLNLSFSCTPFYLNAVDILKDHVDFLKIASYELLWLDLFKKCAHTGLPVVFSTGMATLEEVEDSLQYLLKSNCKEITILHCNSAYPTKIHDANLSGINTLKEIAKSINQKKCTTVKIGYSDHTVSPAVIYRAIHKYNVKLIEFHLDLKRGCPKSRGDSPLEI